MRFTLGDQASSRAHCELPCVWDAAFFSRIRAAHTQLLAVGAIEQCAAAAAHVAVLAIGPWSAKAESPLVAAHAAIVVGRAGAVENGTLGAAVARLTHARRLPARQSILVCGKRGGKRVGRRWDKGSGTAASVWNLGKPNSVHTRAWVTSGSPKGRRVSSVKGEPLTSSTWTALTHCESVGGAALLVTRHQWAR